MISRIGTKNYLFGDKNTENTAKEAARIKMLSSGLDAAVPSQNYKLFKHVMDILEREKSDLVVQTIKANAAKIVHEKAIDIIESKSEDIDTEALSFCTKVSQEYFLDKKNFRTILVKSLPIFIDALVVSEDKESLDVALKAVEDGYGREEVWNSLKKDELGDYLEESLDLIFHTRKDFSIKFTQLFPGTSDTIIDRMLTSLKLHKKNKGDGIDYRDEYGRSFLHIASSSHMPPRVLEKLIGYYKQPQKILDNQGLSPLKCGLKSGRIGIDQFMMWAEAYPKKLGTEHLELVNEQLGKLTGKMKPGGRKYHFHHIKRALSAYGVDDILDGDSKEDGLPGDDPISQKIFDLATYRPDKLLSYRKFNPQKFYGTKQKDILQFLIEQPKNERFGKGSGPDLVTKMFIKYDDANKMLGHGIEKNVIHDGNPIALSLVLEKSGIFRALLNSSTVETLSVIFQKQCHIDDKNYINLFEYIVDKMNKEWRSMGLHHSAMQITVYGFAEDLYPSADRMQKKDPIAVFIKSGKKPADRMFEPAYIDIPGGEKIMYEEFVHRGPEVDKKMRKFGTKEGKKIDHVKLCSAVSSVMSDLTLDAYSSLVDEMVWRYFRSNKLALELSIAQGFYKKHEEYIDLYNFVARLVILDSFGKDGVIQNYELLPGDPDHNITLSLHGMAMHYADEHAPIERFLELFNPNGFSI